jgi:DNA-binding CsgD family transcriptional regulator
MAIDDHELARVTVMNAEQRSAMNPAVRSLAGAAAHARGLWQASVRDLERAIALLAEGRRPLATASALEDVGRVRAERGVARDGIAALDAALTITLDTGATWDATRVRRRLRALGVNRRSVSTPRPKTGWAALTAAEVAVAQLAAGGSTDRQIAEKLFISPHTVNTHLRHVYEKLGVNSRLALSKIAPP